MGKLGTFGKYFEPGLSPDEFKTAFTDHVFAHYNAVWTLFGDTPRGRHAVGMVMGWVHFETVLIVLEIVWFPWASPRNVFEAFANWTNANRDEITILDFTMQGDRPFFGKMVDLGLMRQVGRVHDIYEDGAAMLHQSRRPEKARVY